MCGNGNNKKMNNFLNSIKKNKTGIVLIIFAAMLTSVGQLLWKLSTTNSIYFLLAGFFLYGLGAVTMIIALKFGSLSVIQPLLSVSYIFALVLGVTVLNEKISATQIIATLLILIGVVLIGGGDD